MLPTYQAILTDNHVEWIGDEPPGLAGHIRVYVTLLDPPAPAPARATQGERMAGALEVIANRGGVAAIPDPLAWEREQRVDPELPGRVE